LFLLLAILTRDAVPIQFAVNSELRGVVGDGNGRGDHLPRGHAYSRGGGAFLAREGVSALSDTAGAPWWVWLAGCSVSSTSPLR
jgi:uncharacterized membrane protein YdcZ (DUF606 family)